jgi:hypothetical protein
LQEKNDAYRNIYTFTNKAVHVNQIVGSLSEFAKDDPAQKRELMQDLAKDAFDYPNQN